ncbi:protein of unknown function DUF296 [Macleaya cordata]|uniref:AT-hook motif nuclear-localized protein n=1 Tax=Macleaya cordata TaxID=56857 RepID=A0A200QXR7_MACCD|nr:protein of unknown function DUF296 [Macleaya cordata]
MDAQESTRLSSSSQPPGSSSIVFGSNSYGSMVDPNPNPPNLSSSAAAAATGIMQSPSYNPFNSGVGSSSGFTQTAFGFNMTTTTTASTSNSDQVKKKRGRPRKYTVDGDNIALALTPLSSAPPPPPPPPPHYSHNNNNNNNNHNTQSSDPPPFKRNRGRPVGSGKKQQLDALGSSGVAFTPHVIAVEAGEDVASKIMAFSQQGPHAVCILSANGAICNVTLRQPATFGGTVTYEGRFEIISLSGSFLLTESGGTRSRTGGMSVSLAGSDGRVLGGGVAGMLMAATPVQVVVGKFIMEEEKPLPGSSKQEPSLAPPPPHMMSFGAPLAAGSSPSQDASSESSDEAGSPLNRVPGAFNITGQSVQSMSGFSSFGGWGGSHPAYP